MSHCDIKLLPAGAESNRYIRVRFVSGYPNDPHLEKRQAEAAAVARHLEPEAIFSLKFREERP